MQLLLSVSQSHFHNHLHSFTSHNAKGRDFAAVFLTVTSLPSASIKSMDILVYSVLMHTFVGMCVELGLNSKVIHILQFLLLQEEYIYADTQGGKRQKNSYWAYVLCIMISKSISHQSQIYSLEHSLGYFCFSKLQKLDSSHLSSTKTGSRT